MLLSYDLGRSLERLPAPRRDEFQIPALAIGLYDTVLAIDHVQHRAWLISQGFPETEPARRRNRAAERIKQFESWLTAPLLAQGEWHSPSAGDREPLTADELARSSPCQARPD